jgi:hypothetical protein
VTSATHRGGHAEAHPRARLHAAAALIDDRALLSPAIRVSGSSHGKNKI